MSETIRVVGRDADGITDARDGTTLIIGQGAVLGGSPGTLTAASLRGVSPLLINRGTIDGSGLATNGAAVLADGVLFTLRNEGSITAQNSVAVSGANNTSGLYLVNDGTIGRSTPGTVMFAQSGRIENLGLIEGSGGAPLIGVDRIALPLDIVNAGRIDAGIGATILDASGFFDLVVFGGNDATLSQSTINVANTGQLVGNVTLGTGRDTFETTDTALLNGRLNLFGDDDALLVRLTNAVGPDAPNVTGGVTGGAGFDTITYDVRASRALAPRAYDFERVEISTGTAAPTVTLDGEPAGFNGVFWLTGAGDFVTRGGFAHVSNTAEDRSHAFIRLERARYDGDDIGVSPSLTNRGTLSILSQRGFEEADRDAAVSLDNFAAFTNIGTVNATGPNAVGVLLDGDRRDDNGQVVNQGTIALANQATGVLLDGGFFRNEGRITGNGDGVEISADSATGPFFVNAASGVVSVARSAVLAHEDVAIIRNEGLLASTGNAAILSDQGRFDAPDRFVIINTGEGVIRGGAGRAIVGASDTEIVRNSGRARIEGDIVLGDGGDVVENENNAVIAGTVDTGDGSDAVRNGARIQGSVITGSDGDVYQILGGTGRVDGSIFLGSGDDRFEIGQLRAWEPNAFAGGRIDAGGNNNDLRRDTVSLTVTRQETLRLFETPDTFEGLRVDHEAAVGTSIIAAQSTAYESGYVWVTGLGRVINRLGIERAADAQAAQNVALLIDDSLTGSQTPLTVVNEARLAVTGVGLSGQNAPLTYALYHDIDTGTEHHVSSVGALVARGTGATAAFHSGSDSRFSSNTDSTIRYGGTVDASGGADGIVARGFREGSSDDLSATRGLTTTGTITVSGPGGAAGVDLARVLMRNEGQIQATDQAVAVLVRGDAELHNARGAITATGGVGVFSVGEDNILVNDAAISGGRLAIGSFLDSDGDAGDLLVINRGTITGPAAFGGQGGNEVLENERGGVVRGAIDLGAGGDRVNNAGRIDGNVRLGAGDDAYNVLGGQTNGGVDLGTGDDSLFLNVATAAQAGITGTINAGSGSSEIDRVQIGVSGRGTADPRAASVLSGFEILRVDGIDGGETLTFADVGATVTTGLDVVLLGGGGAAAARAINEADFSTTNLTAVTAIGGDRLLTNGQLGGQLINRADIGLTYSTFGLRSDRVDDLIPEAVFVTAGAELRNEAVVSATGTVRYVDRFDDVVTNVAAAVRTGDTTRDGDRVVSPRITNADGGVIEGRAGAEAIDTQGGAIIVNQGIIRATDVAGNDAAVMDLGNDLVVNAGTIAAGGGATRAIYASAGLRLTNEGSGVIQTQTDAIELDGGGAIIDNRGLITASSGATVLTDTDEQRLVNAGTLRSGSGGGFATIEFRGEFDTRDTDERNFLVNTGTIEKTGGGLAIFGARDTGDADLNTGDGTAEAVLNSGIINGTIDLGDGSDVVYASGGRIGGDVFLGREGDVLVLGDGAITGSAFLGGGEDTLLRVAGTAGRAPGGGVSAGTGIDAAGVLFFADGQVSLTAEAGFEMAAVAAIGLDTDVTVGSIGQTLGVSLRTLGGGRITNRHTIEATFGRAAIEVEDRDIRLVNEGTLRGRVGIDDRDLSLRIENAGAIEASQFGILARGAGIERESESLGDAGRPIINSGTITVVGTGGIGIANVDTDQTTITATGLSLGLTNVFDQTGTLEPRDRPALERSVLIENTGTIAVTGGGVVGIFSDDGDPVIDNAGTVTATGQRARGLVFGDEDGSPASGAGRLVNRGTIEVDGAGADAVWSRASRSSAEDPNVFINAGTVRARGSVLDRTSFYDEQGYVVDFVTAVTMNIGAISNQAGALIEAIDPFGIAIFSGTSQAGPGQNGDDPDAGPREGNRLFITNEGTLRGTDGFFGAFRQEFDPPSGDDYFLYENIRLGAVTGGSGIEVLRNGGLIDGAVALGGGNDEIENSGRIDGDVYLEGGADSVELTGSSRIDGVLDLGSGRDAVSGLGGGGQASSLRVTGGLGTDRFAPSAAVLGTNGATAATIVDFEAGAFGDVLDLSAWTRDRFAGLGQSADLDDAGYVRFRAADADGDGAADDTLVQADLDGARDGQGFVTGLVLLDVAPAAVANGQVIFAGPVQRRLIEGTNADDRLDGTDGPDDLVGFGGNDVLIGGGGGDIILGGGGGDLIYGDTVL